MPLKNVLSLRTALDRSDTIQFDGVDSDGDMAITVANNNNEREVNVFINRQEAAYIIGHLVEMFDFPTNIKGYP